MRAIVPPNLTPALALSCLAASLAWSLPTVADAASPDAYRVRANVDAGHGIVRGSFAIDAHRDADETSICLWLLADKLATDPEAMDEQSARWIFPRRPQHGGVTLRNVHVGAIAVSPEPRAGDLRRDAGGRDECFELPPGTPRAFTLRGHFEVRVPLRFGRLGRVGDRLSLGAPWYPLLLGKDGGWRFEVPHRLSFHTVDTTPPEIVAGGSEPMRGHADVRQRGPYIPVFAASSFDEELVEHRGIRVRVLSPRGWYRAPPEDREGPAGWRDLAHSDRLGPIRETIAAALDTLAATETPRIHIPRTVVSVPSRTEFAGNAPGVVLLTDRAFEVFPLEAIRGYQKRALRRAILRESVAARSRRSDGPLDAGWGADLRAVWLNDVDARRRDEELASPQELLGFAAFNPAIDQLLYAPQVAFVDVYFGAVHEPDLFREDPQQARVATARGKLLLEYARDMVEESLPTLGEALIPRPLERARRDGRCRRGRAAARGLAGRPARAALMTIASGRISSERDPDAEGAGYVHRVTVVRLGAWRRESVEVLVRDRDGNKVTAMWTPTGEGGERERGEVELRTPGRLRQVWVDPRRRRPQSARVAEGHPARHDTNRLPVRPPILQRFEPSFFTEPQLAVSLGMYRKYDIENSFVLSLNLTPRFYGGSLRYVRGFGRPRDLNRPGRLRFRRCLDCSLPR